MIRSNLISEELTAGMLTTMWEDGPLAFYENSCRFVMPRDYSRLHRKLYHTMLADPDGPAWISSKNDSIQCHQHTMDVCDVIAEESRRETKVMDRGVSFPWAMIRFLSISKGAPACVLICTHGIISNGDTNKTPSFKSWKGCRGTKVRDWGV